MQNVNVDAKSLWMQFEDVLAPRLGLTSKERVVYSYLLRHSLVVGKTRVQFPLIGLGRLLGFSATSARHAVRRLEDLEVLRIVKRNNDGHLAEMSLPENIRATRERGNSLSFAKRASGGKSAAKLDALDFFSSRALRKAIHDRERGACFYCLRRNPATVRCLDHAVPRVRRGRNSYRNLVSCCIECNSRKGDCPARDFLRTLYRAGRLTGAELDARLRALKDLAAGRLRPSL